MEWFGFGLDKNSESAKLPYIIAFLLKTGHYVSVWILIQSINILDPQNCTYISFFAVRIGTYRKNLLCSGSWPGGPP